MSAISLQEYAATVTKSGLLSSDELNQQYEAFRSNSGDDQVQDAETFAEFLQTEQLLTAWQNANLLKGKHRGLIFGKFKMLKLLGAGGMGRVFLAQDQMLKRQVALKVLPKKLSTNDQILQRFHREAQALARLNHDNIVRVHDVDVREKTHYIVMEYLQGIDLQKYVFRNGPMDAATAAEFTRQVAQGLAHAHDHNLIHRDIKPANMLLDTSGVVKVLDLGLALLQTDEDGSITVDPTKAMGTADFISPEQALNSHDLDHRTDIYSLGCSLYFFLTGSPPFANGTNAQRLLAHQMSNAKPINDLRRDKNLEEVDDHLVQICQRLMKKKPEERFEDCHVLSDALAKYASGENIIKPVIQESDLVLGGSASNVQSGDTNNDSTRRKTQASVLEIVTDESHERDSEGQRPNQSNGSKSTKSKRTSTRRKKQSLPLLIGTAVALAVSIGGVGYLYFGGTLERGDSRTETTVIQPSPTLQRETVFYRVGNGTKYHLPNCKHVTGSSRARPIPDEQLSQFGPCGVCNPDQAHGN